MSVLGVPDRTLGLWFTETEIAFAIVEADGCEVMRGRVPRASRGRTMLLDARPPNLQIAVVANQRLDPLLDVLRTEGIRLEYQPSESIGLLGLSAAPGTEALPEATAAMLARLQLLRQRLAWR